MAVIASDLAHLESEDTDSTGGAITASGIASNVTNNVWPDITDSQRVSGITLYRKTFWKNNNASDAMLAPVMYAPTLPTNATFSIGMGVDDSADDDSGQGNMTAWTGNAVVSVISDAADTRFVNLYGLDNAGTPVPTYEQVQLNGTTEVLSSTTFSKVWAAWVVTTDGVNTVSVRQGSGGTTRGTIGPTKKGCWLWVTGASSKGAGIALPNLAALQSYGIWMRLVVGAGAGAVRPNSLTTRIEEDV